jgi:hypothetical protein
MFKRIDHVEIVTDPARSNRAVLYRGVRVHSESPRPDRALGSRCAIDLVYLDLGGTSWS